MVLNNLTEFILLRVKRRKSKTFNVVRVQTSVHLCDGCTSCTVFRVGSSEYIVRYYILHRYIMVTKHIIT